MSYSKLDNISILISNKYNIHIWNFPIFLVINIAYTVQTMIKVSKQFNTFETRLKLIYSSILRGMSRVRCFMTKAAQIQEVRWVNDQENMQAREEQ